MDTLPEKIFVIAGTMEQFRMFRNQLAGVLTAEGHVVNTRDLVYVNGPDTLRGIRKPWGYLVGTWEKREDLWQIVDMINVCHSKVTEDFIEVAL